MSATSVTPTTPTTNIVDLNASEHGYEPHREQLGGKALHLMELTAHGRRVPPGFTVTVDAYRTFIEENGLRERMRAMVAEVAHDDIHRLEQQTAELRELVTTAAMPTTLREEILKAYAALGGDRVAVRSSGIAEDLADASFAGQHDTYLDIVGDDEVIDAVQRCWASMWATRAVIYRRQSDHATDDLGIAVVVQRMVEAEVAGVMFTANPVSGATDEIVINAGWGLGEGVVSGAMTPDQFCVRKKSWRIKSRELGGKERTVVRDPDTGVGTITVDTEASKRTQWTLDDEQVRKLAKLGAEIEALYEGMPQDIEWAYRDGEFNLLQSRDVTGVELRWDEDVDGWQDVPDDPEVVWTRGFADEFWTGAITPLFYSVYALGFQEAHEQIVKEWGFPKFGNVTRHIYRQGEAYMSSDYQKTQVLATTIPMFRAPLLSYLATADRREVENAPFSLRKYVKLLARVELMTEQSMFQWIDYAKQNAYEVEHLPFGHVLEEDEWQQFSDAELKRAIKRYTDFATYLHTLHWSGFFIHAPNALSALGLLLAKWYDGDNPTIFVDLVSGLPERSITMKENLAMWAMAQEVRSSEVLRDLFEKSKEDEFFEAAARIPEGQELARMQRDMVEQHGHRGHADRDIWYRRRADDPSIDYRFLRALLSTDSAKNPEETEQQLVKAREAATQDVIDRLNAQPFGSWRVQAFKLILNYTHKFLTYRDDERHYIDRVNFAIRRGFCEVNRRLVERGRLEGDTDFYFLARDELYQVLDGNHSPRLIAAKIKGRRAAFTRFDKREVTPPFFIKDGEPWQDPEAVIESGEADGSGVFVGTGTSRGTVTGTARVIRELTDIGRVQEGDILITNSTDPAWTPVFMVISGLVLEAGGMLSHGACLSREYNLPAVTVPSAIQKIEDGSTIRVDGSTGVVEVIHTP